MNTPTTTNDTYTCSWETTGPKAKPSDRNFMTMTMEEMIEYFNRKQKDDNDEPK